jgi:transmembrane sensor
MSARHAATPPELDAALRARADGAALQAVWDAVPDRVTDASTRTVSASTDRARDAAWVALSARLADPARVRYTDDVTPSIALLTEEGETAAETDLPPRDASVPTRPATPSITQPITSRRVAGVGRRVAISALVGLAASIGVMVWGAVPVTLDGAASGAPTAVTLGDGSQVWLASGATLQVPRALGWPSVLRTRTRALSLSGTAFFAVARDGRPFTVAAGDVTVGVLGTRFEVRARAAGSQVLVEEGRVAVRANATGAQVELGAGEATRLETRQLAVTRVAAARVGAWRQGGLAALDEPLRDVLAELTRRYGTELTIEADVAGDALVSLFYPQAPALDVVLADLCTAQGLRFRQTSRGVVIARGLPPE